MSSSYPFSHRGTLLGNRRQWLLFAFILLFPLLAAWIYFVLLAGTAWAKPAYFVAKVVQFSFPVVYLQLWQRTTLKVRPPDKKGFLLGLVSGFVIAAVILIAYYGYYRSSDWLQNTGLQVWNKLKEMGADTRWQFLSLAVFLSVVHALLEEYYWRWFVWEQLARRWSSWRAILIANVGFTLHHIVVLYVYIPASHFWTDGVLFSAAVLVGGIVWSLLYRYTNSIYSAWMSHAITDGALMFLGYDLCRNYWP